ncbi:hypothetical protein [Devosia submarina]|uniref:hypothetical protein n=1 Tax=Devosia submarina TaxID=1173082 RepID=UPI000D3824A0|nr:hypothetical protein [Devosia submarina]
MPQRSRLCLILTAGRLLAASAIIPAGDIALVLLESGLSVPLQILLHAVSSALLLTLSILRPREGSLPHA